jgi:hypothetical protein
MSYKQNQAAHVGLLSWRWEMRGARVLVCTELGFALNQVSLFRFTALADKGLKIASWGNGDAAS